MSTSIASRPGFKSPRTVATPTPAAKSRSASPTKPAKEPSPAVLLRQRVLMLLRSLGGTSTEVATSLASAGIRGERWSCYGCPVGKFLLKHGGCVNYYSPTTRAARVASMDARALVKFPDPVWDFSFEFVNGQFPELEEPAAAPAFTAPAAPTSSPAETKATL